MIKLMGVSRDHHFEATVFSGRRAVQHAIMKSFGRPLQLGKNPLGWLKSPARSTYHQTSTKNFRKDVYSICSIYASVSLRHEYSFLNYLLNFFAVYLTLSRKINTATILRSCQIGGRAFPSRLNIGCFSYSWAAHWVVPSLWHRGSRMRDSLRTPALLCRRGEVGSLAISLSLSLEKYDQAGDHSLFRRHIKVEACHNSYISLFKRGLKRLLISFRRCCFRFKLKFGAIQMRTYMVCFASRSVKHRSRWRTYRPAGCGSWPLLLLGRLQWRRCFMNSCIKRLLTRHTLRILFTISL